MREYFGSCREAFSSGDYIHVKGVLQANHDGLLEWLNTRRYETIAQLTDSEGYTVSQMTSNMSSMLPSLISREVYHEGEVF